MSDNQEVKRPNSVSRLKIPALRGKDAPNNIAILTLVALRGSMNKYDLYSALPGKNVPGKQKEKNYPTVSRRVDDLVSRGYLVAAGSKLARKGTKREERVTVYGLTWRGMLAALSEEEVLSDVTAVLERHKESLQFPAHDIVMRVLARWPEETIHDARLLWLSFLKALPSDIEEIPQDKYVAYLSPSITNLDEQLDLPPRIDPNFVITELLTDPKDRDWAKRETARTVQQLKKQLEIWEKMAEFLGVKTE
jgi:hypothetical protein